MTTSPPLTTAPPAARRDRLTAVAAWSLGIHALLVASLVALVALTVVGSGSSTGWDHWSWGTLALVIVGATVLGAPWTMIGGSADIGALGMFVNLALHACAWVVLLTARRRWRARRHP